MQVSVELRWFISGPKPTAFDQWFRRSAFAPGGGVEREDIYVVDKSTQELGIKLRDGKPGLEIKSLVDARFSTVTVGDVAVPVQLWTKSATKVLKLDGIPTVVTKKTRWLRKFDTSDGGVHEIELGGGGNKEEPVEGKRPDVGCNVELTEVRLGDQAWGVTFGVEAFAFVSSGAMEAMKDGLARTMRALQAAPIPGLSDWTLDSYPSWLARVV